MDAMFFIVLGATLASFLLTLLFGRFVIPMLCALHAGQSIREVGPQWHNTKAGTPTMGGIMFIAAIILCTVGFGWKSMTENHDYTHLYVLGLALCYGLVGFADDFVKVKLKRNLGLTAIQKFLLQLVVAVVFLFVLKNSGDLSCDLYIPFWNLDLEIPTAVYMVFAAFVIVGCVNAVNLTDGVDGLSSSVTIPVMVFFATTSYIYGRTTLALLPATVAGGLAGLLGGRRIPERLQKTLMSAMGVSVLFVGVSGTLSQMLRAEGGALTVQGTMMMILSLAVGAVLSELLDLEDRMERFGAWLKVKTKSESDGGFIGAFVTASLTVCIGAMAIVGSIQDGILGDHATLFAKAVLDLVIIMVMTASMGKGCIFSAIPVGILQGSVTLLARLLQPVFTDAALSNLSLVGSVLVFCVGLNLVWGKKIRVANLLPSLLIAVIWAFL